MKINEIIFKLKNLVLKKEESIAKTSQNITEEKEQNDIKEDFELQEKFTYELDDYVDEFIEWYKTNMVKGHYTNIGVFHIPNDLRNFIEKVAVWYELRYPQYEINRMMPGSNQESKDVSKIMFQNNINSTIEPIKLDYLNNDSLDWHTYCSLDWADFFNPYIFIQSLPYEEKSHFNKTMYPSKIDLGINKEIWLSNNGEIKYLKGLSPKEEEKDTEVSKKLIGENIKEVLPIIMETYDINSDEKKDIETIIKNYENNVYKKEELLNCIMYRIIERGGNRIGPRRGFLFAKEFGRNIDIPMIYGVDTSDPGLRRFVNEYIKAGGRKETVCYENYFLRTRKNQPLETMTVQRLIKTTWNNCSERYTEEEKSLQQQFVSLLGNERDRKKQIDEEQGKSKHKRKIIGQFKKQI